MEPSVEATETIARVALKYGATKAYVFESSAPGDAREGSDIDALVEFEPGRTLLVLVRLERELAHARQGC